MLKEVITTNYTIIQKLPSKRTIWTTLPSPRLQRIEKRMKTIWKWIKSKLSIPFLLFRSADGNTLAVFHREKHINNSAGNKVISLKCSFYLFNRDFRLSKRSIHDHQTSPKHIHEVVRKKFNPRLLIGRIELSCHSWKDTTYIFSILSKKNVH